MTKTITVNGRKHQVRADEQTSLLYVPNAIAGNAIYLGRWGGWTAGATYSSSAVSLGAGGIVGPGMKQTGLAAGVHREF